MTNKINKKEMDQKQAGPGYEPASTNELEPLHISALS